MSTLYSFSEQALLSPILTAATKLPLRGRQERLMGLAQPWGRAGARSATPLILRENWQAHRGWGGRIIRPGTGLTPSGRRPGVNALRRGAHSHSATSPITRTEWIRTSECT